MHDLLVKGFDLWGRLRDYVTLGLLATTLVASAGWYITDLHLDTAEATIEQVEALRVSDRETYARAQAEFEVRALENKQRIEQENRERAEQADREYTALLERHRASLLRYRESPAAGSTSSPGDLSGSPASSTSPDGPSESADFSTVRILYTDAEICTENTARLEAAREWALGLQN